MGVLALEVGTAAGGGEATAAVRIGCGAGATLPDGLDVVPLQEETAAVGPPVEAVVSPLVLGSVGAVD